MLNYIEVRSINSILFFYNLNTVFIIYKYLLNYKIKSCTN